MECSHRSLVGKHGIITNVSENCYYISGIGGSAGNRNSKVLGKRKNHSSNHVESSESKDSEAAKIEDCEKDIHGQAVVIRVIKAESVMAILLPEPSELDDRLSDSTRQSSGVCSAIKIGADGQSDFVPCTPLALQPIQKHRGQVCILHGSKYLRLPTSGGKT